MLFSLSGGIKPISTLSAMVAKRATESLRKARVVGHATPLPAARVEAQFLESLPPEKSEDLVRYIESPDFDQICFEYSLQRRVNLGAGHKRSEEIRTSIRRQLSEGLRHFTSLDPADRTIVADLLQRDIVAAAEEVIPAQRAAPDETEVAAAGQATAVGVRNGRMLSDLADLRAVHAFSRRMRAQVRNLRGELSLPHVRGARKVPYADLWVEPQFRNLRDKDLSGAPESRPMFDGRHVLLGAPGAGKSTMAQKVAYDVAGAAFESQGLVPFLVILRNFADEMTTAGRPLDDFLEMQCAEPYGLRPPPDAVPYLLQNGRAVVILDGLDELTRVTMRRRVVELIEGFAFNYPSASILVTSRKVGYEYSPLSEKLFDTWELEPFDDERVAGYARKWFALDSALSRATEDPGGQERYDSFLRESESIGDLRRNGLMLSLLCGLYVAEHFIPANRADVYRRCAELLFAQWDTMREIVSHEQSVLAARTALRHVAWLLFSETTDGRLGRAALFDRLREHFAERSDEDIAYSKAEAFLEVCAGRSWVLAEVGSTVFEQIYAFVHRSFLEYFAAEHLAARCPTVPDLHRAVGERIRQGEWPEVTHLAVQLHVLNKGGSDAFAELLLGERDSQFSLFFVARMLSYTGFSPVLLRSVVSEAVTRALDAQNPENRLGANPLRAILTDSSPENLEMVRRALSEALRREQDVRPSEVLVLAASIRNLLGSASRARSIFWIKFADRVLADVPRFDVATPDRRRRLLLIWQAQRDLGAARELLRTGPGAADLYSSIDLRGAHDPAPVVGLLGLRIGVAAGQDADAVMEALLGLPLPWLDRIPPATLNPALREIATQMPARMTVAELSVRTLLSIPVLEWATTVRERKEATDGLAVESAQLAQRSPLFRARKAGEAATALVREMTDRRCAPELVDFVEKWVSGRVSTIAG